MKAGLLEHLHSLVQDASKKFKDVTERRMFGCQAFFKDDTIFGLIWKTGRIGLKFPDPEVYERAMALPDAAPWTAGAKTMSHWVLLPERYHDDPEGLQGWVNQAHALAKRAAGTAAKPKTPRKTKVSG